MTENSKLYRADEVAEILNFKPKTIKKWIKEGFVQAVKIGSSWRIEQSEVDRLKRGSVRR